MKIQMLRLACLAGTIGTVLMSTPLAAAIVNVTPTSNWVSILNNASALQPGDELVFAAGTYSTSSRLSLGFRGTAAQGITLRPAAGANVIITRPNQNQNTLNLEGAQYLTLEGFDITGGSAGIRINSGNGFQSKFITLDGNHIHHVGNAAISANVGGNSYQGMHFLNNELDHTSAEGEGMYLGCNNNDCQFFDSVIEQNYIHHTNGPSVTQGDGIELKLGSYNNLVRNNVIHDTGFPGILAYGTSGNGAPNVFEGNVVWGSDNETVQIASDAIVRNNLIFASSGGSFLSQNHQAATPGNLTLVNNTIIADTQNAISINSSVTAPIVIANNAIYSRTNRALQLPGLNNITLSGNVGSGSVSPGLSQTQFNSTGNLVTDFLGLDWTGPGRNAFPALASKLIGAGNATLQPTDDFNATSRTGSNDAGAYVFDPAGNPGWAVGEGFKFVPVIVDPPGPVTETISQAVDIQGFGGDPNQDANGQGTPILVAEVVFALPEIDSLHSIGLQLAHSYSSDIQIEIDDPTGATTVVVLGVNQDMLNNGLGTDDSTGLGDGSGTNLANVRDYVIDPTASEDFKDGAAGGFLGAGSYAGDDWVSGSFAAGNWTVRIIDAWDENDPGSLGDVSISYVLPTQPGDFDSDSDVDGDDFLAWQRDTNVGNLADWQTNYGNNSTLASSTAVPEPSSLALLLVGLFALKNNARATRPMRLGS